MRYYETAEIIMRMHWYDPKITVGATADSQRFIGFPL